MRAVRRGNGTVERRFDYYPFGSESRHWAWSGQLPFPKTQAGGDAIPKGGGFDFDFEPIILGARAATSRWRFGGKEIAGQKVGASVSQNGTPSAPAGTPAAAAGRPYLDFGARLYEPRTAAWLSQDPLTEKYYSISPFVYCLNSPLNVIDPFGLTYYWVDGEMQEIDDGYYDTMEVTQREYNRLQRKFARSDTRYTNFRSRLMDRNGYVDSEGNPVLAASNVIAGYGSRSWFNLLDAGVSFMSGGATEVGRFLYNPDTQRWFGGRFRFGTYGMNFYGNQSTWKQKNVVKAGKHLTHFGNIIAMFGLAKSVYDYGTSLSEEEKADATLDLLVGTAGFTPYVGPWISLYWSLGGKKLHYKYLEEVIMPQYEMGILGYPSTMPFK